MEFAKINVRISFGNIELAKINTRKKQSKHHSQKLLPAKNFTIKLQRMLKLEQASTELEFPGKNLKKTFLFCVKFLA